MKEYKLIGYWVDHTGERHDKLDFGTFPTHAAANAELMKNMNKFFEQVRQSIGDNLVVDVGIRIHGA